MAVRAPVELLSAPNRKALQSLAAAPKLTIVVGAGASQSSGLPSWTALMQALLMTSLTAVPEAQRVDDPELFASLIVGRHPPASVAEWIRARMDGAEVAHAIREALYGGKQIEPGVLPITLAVLAATPDCQTFTTNYDDLIERSSKNPLWLANDSPELLSSVDPTQDDREHVNIFHLHGYVPYNLSKFNAADHDRIILSERDYAESESRAEPLFAAFENRLRESATLLIGCSLSDPNILRFLLRTRNAGNRQPCYGIFPIADAQVDRFDSSRLPLVGDVAEAIMGSRIGLFPTQNLERTFRDASDKIDRNATRFFKERLDRLGVTTLWADQYSEIPQFIWELALLRSEWFDSGASERPDLTPDTWRPSTPSFGSRVRTWRTEWLKSHNFTPESTPDNGGRDELSIQVSHQEFRDAQAALRIPLLESLNKICMLFWNETLDLVNRQADHEHVDHHLAHEHVGLHLWIYCPRAKVSMPDRRPLDEPMLEMIASTANQYDDPWSIPRHTLYERDRIVVNTFADVLLQREEAKGSGSRRWRNRVAVPITQLWQSGSIDTGLTVAGVLVLTSDAPGTSQLVSDSNRWREVGDSILDEMLACGQQLLSLSAPPHILRPEDP